MMIHYKSATVAERDQQLLSRAGIAAQVKKTFHPRVGCEYRLHVDDKREQAARQILERKSER